MTHDGESTLPEDGRAAIPTRIALVDDDGDHAECMAELLRLLGHEVIVSVDKPSALATIPGFQPDLIFLDLGLRGMDGCEVAMALRSDPTMAGVCITALTGYQDDAAMQRARDAGIDEYLVKPIQPATLPDFVERSVRAKRARLGA